MGYEIVDERPFSDRLVLVAVRWTFLDANGDTLTDSNPSYLLRCEDSGLRATVRRRNMQANRRRYTKPELALRSALHRAGFRYRVDYRIDLPGGRVRPDIVFTRKRIAVFVDGCFWHCCPEHGSRPSINQSYWSLKLARNVERDAQNTKLLREADWTVVRIWEHESVPSALTRVTEALMTCAEGKRATRKPRMASLFASCSPSSG